MKTSLKSVAMILVLSVGLVLMGLGHAESDQKTLCASVLKIPAEFNMLDSKSLEGNSNIQSHSLSSWTWIPNIDPNRIPEVILEAQCHSEYCSSPSSGQQDLRLNSVAIQQDLLVLHRNNKRCFTPSFERVTVGCTCVRAKTAE